MNKTDISEKSRAYKNPVLVLQGRRGQVGESMPYIISQTYSNSKFVFIIRCGHFPWIEQPTTFFDTWIIEEELGTPVQSRVGFFVLSGYSYDDGLSPTNSTRNICHILAYPEDLTWINELHMVIMVRREEDGFQRNNVDHPVVGKFQKTLLVQVEVYNDPFL